MRDLRLIVPEFDTKRKYGLSFPGLVDLLVKCGFIRGALSSILEFQDHFCGGSSEMDDVLTLKLLDELASTCKYSTPSTTSTTSTRNKLEIIRDLYMGLCSSDGEYLTRIIIKQFKSDPMYRLHQVHPCAVVIYKNQMDLFTLGQSLSEIDRVFNRNQLQDKSTRIQVYREYGRPKVVLSIK